MKRKFGRKKRTPIFIACDRCIELYRIFEKSNSKDAEIRQEGFIDYRAYNKKRQDLTDAFNDKFPTQGFNSKEEFMSWLLEGYAELYTNFQFTCFYNFHFPHRAITRTRYKLKCFHCGDSFGCPSKVYRYRGKPLCSECYASATEPDNYPDDFDEDEDYQKALLRKYGEY